MNTTEDTPNIELPSADDVAKFAKVEAAPAAPVDPLAALTRERDELKDRLLRAQAEQANIVKRLNQQHGDAIKYAQMGLARSILTVHDNLERTLASLKNAKPDDPVVAGVRLIVEQLEKLLRDHGVSSIESIGQPFDPMLHEAMLHDRQSDKPAGTVTQEFERGYRLHDRVLRHAKVAVAADEAEGEPAAA
ncbi:MAG: nucleotide exchange factor GrpE [Planctomycetes bacterium]|nr:nucleotide exchange factor GrpE [Planctomycetota bacterium]